MQKRREMQDDNPQDGSYKAIGGNQSANTGRGDNFKAIGGTKSANTGRGANYKAIGGSIKKPEVSPDDGGMAALEKQMAGPEIPAAPLFDFDAHIAATHLKPIVTMNEMGDDSGAKAYKPRASSFDIKSTKDEKVTIRGGVVRQGGRGKVIVPDTDITPGGSSGAPNYALLEISASGTLTATIVCMATDAEDTGSNCYVTLWEVYSAGGKAKVLKDRRQDILLRSPI